MFGMVRSACAACLMWMPLTAQANMLGFEDGVLVFPNLAVIGMDTDKNWHFVGDIEVYPDLEVSDEGEILAPIGVQPEVQRRCVHITAGGQGVALQERTPCDVHVLPKWLDDTPGWEVQEAQLRDVAKLFADVLPDASGKERPRLVKGGDVPQTCKVALDWVARTNAMVSLNIDTAPVVYDETVGLQFDLTQGSVLLQQGLSAKNGARLTHYRMSMCGT